MPNYPMIGDEDLAVAKLYNMLPAGEVASDGRTADTNATVRSVSDEDAKALFPAGFKTLKPYLRTTKQPG